MEGDTQREEAVLSPDEVMTGEMNVRLVCGLGYHCVCRRDSIMGPSGNLEDFCLWNVGGENASLS